MGAFTAAESNNQIEAENSSHQALKRAWEQLSYRIRYDKSKTITARCDTELEKNKRTSKTKLTFQVERCCSICHWWPGVFLSGFPVVVWARPGLAQHAPASHWETWLHAGLRSVELVLVLVLVLHQRALHTGGFTLVLTAPDRLTGTRPAGAAPLWIPLGAECCHRHNSARAVAPSLLVVCCQGWTNIEQPNIVGTRVLCDLDQKNVWTSIKPIPFPWHDKNDLQFSKNQLWIIKLKTRTEMDYFATGKYYIPISTNLSFPVNKYCSQWMFVKLKGGNFVSCLP